MPDTGWCPFVERISGVTTYEPGYRDRVGFCDHTAGGYYSTLQNPVFWNAAGVSVHFNIAKDGRACQTVNIFDTAYAQGRLGPRVIWTPYTGINPNALLISTEHEDQRETNMVWPEAMYQTDLRIKRWCIKEVERVAGKDLLRFGIDSLAGHYMFDQVNRPYCPGTGWPRERLYDDLTNAEEGDDMYIVSKALTGDPDSFKSYLVQGKEWRHIPDTATFDALAMLELELHEPNKTAWDFMVLGAKFIEES